MVRLSLALAAFALILSLVISFAKSADRENTVSGDSFMENVSIVHISSDAVTWQADVGKVIFRPDGESSEIRNVLFTFPDRKIKAFSDKGTYNMETDDLVLYDDFHAQMDDLTIVTDSVEWSSSGEKLSSGSETIIRSDTLMVRGDSFTASGDGKIMLQDNVKAIVHE